MCVIDCCRSDTSTSTVAVVVDNVVELLSFRLTGSFDGCNSNNFEQIFLGGKLGFTDGKVLGYYEGIKLGSTDGKLLGTIFGN